MASRAAEELRLRHNGAAVAKAGRRPAAPASSSSNVQPDFLEEVDAVMTQVERLIVGDHTTRLQEWTSRSCSALEQAERFDISVLEAQVRECEECASSVETDAEALEAARTWESEVVADARERNTVEFRSEMQELGDMHARASVEFVAKSTSSMRARCEAAEAREWHRVDELTAAIAWDQARRHTNARDASLQELFTSGTLQPLLDAERDGWSRSQQTDFERLQSDVDNECREIFRGLRQRLEEHQSIKYLVRNDGGFMTEMEEKERARFAAAEAEAAGPYEAEARAALEQCEQDYRAFDSELQEVLFRTFQHRQDCVAAMRQLKLALCGWRLDYQREYHEQLEAVATNPPEATPLRKRRPCTATIAGEASSLAMLRRSAQRLWSSGRGLPSADVHRFLASASDLSAKHGLADSLVRLYEEELRRYNALPLLEHARQPELLDCWLRTLARARRADKGPPTVATPRGSD